MASKTVCLTEMRLNTIFFRHGSGINCCHFLITHPWIGNHLETRKISVRFGRNRGYGVGGRSDCPASMTTETEFPRYIGGTVSRSAGGQYLGAIYERYNSCTDVVYTGGLINIQRRTSHLSSRIPPHEEAFFSRSTTAFAASSAPLASRDDLPKYP
jgi:hypothetical protein